MPTFAIPNNKTGVIAQLVEQRTENPCVPGSIPGDTTKNLSRSNSAEVFRYCSPTISLKRFTILSEMSVSPYACVRSARWARMV